MSFVNTIDLLGDKMVFKSIVDGTITEFKDDVLQAVGDYAFYQKEQLTTVDLPAVTTIGEYAFYKCTALTSANVPNLISLNTRSFEYCEKLSSIELPLVDSVANYSFRYCGALKRVDLPRATHIGNYAFLGCELEALILRSETMCTLYSDNAIQGTGIADGTGYVYVPRALIEEYRADTKWATRAANQFRAIEDYPDICG